MNYQNIISAITGGVIYELNINELFYCTTDIDVITGTGDAGDIEITREDMKNNLVKYSILISPKAGNIFTDNIICNFNNISGGVDIKECVTAIIELINAEVK